MGKEDNKGTQGLADVDMYLTQIKSIIKNYRRLVDKLEAIKNDGKKTLEKMDLITERDGVKKSFIAKKQACRANIALLNQSLASLKDRELKDLQEEYRELDSEFKALGVMVERNELLGGGRGEGKLDMTRATNDELLDKALDTQKNTTSKLREAAAGLATTKEQALYTAAQLESDREKMARISKGLDEVESELEISKKLLTRFVKRLYTDKIIIAFTCLLVCGIAGIITYSIINPDQTTFAVPDVIKPPNPFASSPTPSASPAAPQST